MNIRIKDLWMRRTAVERVFTAKLPAETAALLSGVGERLWDEFTEYQILRKKVWDRLGLTAEENPKKMTKKQAEERQKNIEQFNSEVAELAEAEINYPHEPIPVEKLHGLSLSVVDLVALQQLGVIKNGR